MIHIVSCTNRPGSLSKLIALQYEEILLHKGAKSTLVDLSEMPEDYLHAALYDRAGTHPQFNTMRAAMEAATKYAFVIPEYNGSFPGVFKAFVDGLKYPSTFKNKKAALIGVSSGIQGGALALSHTTDIFHYLGLHVLGNRVKLYKIESKMENGKITDPGFVQLLEKQAEALIQF